MNCDMKLASLLIFIFICPAVSAFSFSLHRPALHNFSPRFTMGKGKGPKFVPPVDEGKSNNDGNGSDDSFMDLQSCCDVLGSLLDSRGRVNALKPEQVAAIQQLRSSVSVSTTDKDHSSHDKRRGKIFQSLRDRRKKRKSRLAVETFVREALSEMEEHDNEAVQVLDTYGGWEEFESSIAYPSIRGDDRKIVALRNGRISGNRINLLFTNYEKRQTAHGKRNLFGGSIRLSDFSAKSVDYKEYCPPEWKALTPEAKLKLSSLLSWESLSKWDFNIVEVTELTRNAVKDQCCPLLLVGWAILCEPMAQEAMQQSVGIEGGRGVYLAGESKAFSYQFPDHMMIHPEAICNFLREVESRYKPENSYHNSIHASDVTQTTHCLLQLMGEQRTRSICDPITIFSLLLSATFHDVCHPGTNNLFQKNAMTPLAIKYNDVSILENMHSAVGHSLLMGEEGNDDWDVFEGWEHEDKVRARSVMTSSILHTDMSNHFQFVKELDSLIDKVEVSAKMSANDSAEEDITNSDSEEKEPEAILSILSKTLEEADGKGEDSESTLEGECSQLSDMLIKFILHVADISNPAKPEAMSLYWADCVVAEFFAQGKHLNVTSF